MSEIKVLKDYAEKLGLDTETSINSNHVVKLREALEYDGEFELADYVSRLKANELEDLIVNTAYGME